MFTVVVGVVAFFGRWSSGILQELVAEELMVALSSRRLAGYCAFSDTGGTRICHPAEEFVLFPSPRPPEGVQLTPNSRVRQLHCRGRRAFRAASCLGGDYRLASLASQLDQHVDYNPRCVLSLELVLSSAQIHDHNLIVFGLAFFLP